MIIHTLNNTNPYGARSGINSKITVSAISSPLSVLKNDFCYCASECNYIETAFAEPLGEDYKNDRASFLFQKLSSSDTIVFDLYKDGQKIATISDNTYGVYYDGFDVAPLYVGFVLEWEKVIDLHGAGMYQVRTKRTILGVSDELESVIYRLLPYSDDHADKTVKIVGKQTGNIKGNPLDFTGLLPDGWAFYVRVDGWLKLVNPTYIQDNYLDSNDTRLQIQDKIVSNYEVNILQAPASVLNLFLKGFISLANDISITDYNLFNVQIYRDLKLYTQDFNYEPIMNQRRQDLVVLFSEKTEDTKIRNF